MKLDVIFSPAGLSPAEVAGRPVFVIDVSIFPHCFFERSGEMMNISSPRFVDLSTRFAPK